MPGFLGNSNIFYLYSMDLKEGERKREMCSLIVSSILSSFSNSTRVCVCVLSCSVVPDTFGTHWTVVCQAPLSMEFSRQEYGSGLPFPPLGSLPTPGIKLMSLGLLHWQADSLVLSHQGSPLFQQLLVDSFWVLF